MTHLYKAIPIKKERMIHMDSHIHRGFEIVPYGLGYEAVKGSVRLFASSGKRCAWVRLEEMIDELEKSTN